MAADFTSIPLIDYRDSTSLVTKHRFLAALRHALVNVGFFYLQNPPIGLDLRQQLVKETGAFFDLPAEKKLEVNVANSKHFRGYACSGTERTATKKDQRETFTVGFEAPIQNSELPIYYHLQGPNQVWLEPGAGLSNLLINVMRQWLPETTVPGLRQTVETYLKETQAVADEFMLLIPEALGLNPTVFTKLLRSEPPMSSLRIGAYAEPDDWQVAEPDVQGVGPHKDGSFLTYLLQGTNHSSLEVQNKCGMWIPVPPIPNTLVINIGRSLESLTQGVCAATTHRVALNKEQYYGTDNTPLGTRLSFAFFQMLALDVTRNDMVLELPPHLATLRGEDVKSDAETFFTEVFKGPAGQALLTNIILSHPEMGQRWYPDLLAKMLKEQQEAKDLDDAK